MKKSILIISAAILVGITFLHASDCQKRLANITSEVCNRKTIVSTTGNTFDGIRGDITGRCKSGYANYKITPISEQDYQYTYANIEYYSSDPQCICPATQYRQCMNEIKVGDPRVGEFLNWQSCVN